MATVHIGRLLGQVGFSRTIAIKRMHEHCAKDPDFVSMFIDEARLAARIRHPNVVPTLDVVVLDGELFLVMEYVQGETLSRLCRRSQKTKARIPPRIAASVVAGVLEGLHAAHEAVGEHGEPLGIVHRDVSPQNVIVGNDGIARVLDFGVAKASNRLQTTRSGEIKGKIEYMAPEQVRGSLVDRRTDVYAASVILWELLTGRRLFMADNPVALWGKVLEGTVVRPAEIEPNVPAELDAVTMRGLHMDPTLRYQSAEAMAIELEQAIHLATPREVGRWVHGLAGKTLREREEIMAELDSVASGISLSATDLASDVSVRVDRASSSPPQSRSEAPGSWSVPSPQRHGESDHPKEVRPARRGPPRPPRPAGVPRPEPSTTQRDHDELPAPPPKPATQSFIRAAERVSSPAIPAPATPGLGAVAPPPANVMAPPPASEVAPPAANGVAPPPANEVAPPAANEGAPPAANEVAPPAANEVAPPPDFLSQPEPVPQVTDAADAVVPDPSQRDESLRSVAELAPLLAVDPAPDVVAWPDGGTAAQAEAGDEMVAAFEELPVQRSRWPFVIAGAAVVGFAAGAALLLSMGGTTEPAPAPSTARSVVTSTAAAQTAEPAPTPSASALPVPVPKISLNVVVSPKTATIEVDDKVMSGSSVQLEESSVAVRVVAKAPGYKPEERSFTPSQDGRVVIELERLPTPGAATGKVKIKGPVETEL